MRIKAENVMYVKDRPAPKVVAGQPLISIVMTTYNGALYVAEQIESILGQTHRNFELIIADDCSTDRTLEILQYYASGDGRIRYYVNDSNLGVNRNLNVALQQVTGDLVAIADQDDIWEPQKLEILYGRIGGSPAVYSDSLLIDAVGQSLGLTLLERIGVHRSGIGKASLVLLRKNCVSGHALLFRKSLIDLVLPFESGLMFDQQLGIAAVLNGGLNFVDMLLVRHRIHGKNQTHASLQSKPIHEGSKAERYRRRRTGLVNMLKFFLSHIDRNSEHYRSIEHAQWLHERIIELINRLQKFDRIWFDFRLFILLLTIRKDLFYSGEPNVLKRCLTYAKGARYYR